MNLTWGFWLLVSVLLAAHFLRHKILNNDRAINQTRLEIAANKLELLVRTQPPAEFQRQLGVHVEKNLVLFDSTTTLVETVDSIAVAIEGLAMLAALYDQGTNEGVYAANLMIFVPADGPTSEEWFKLVKFHPEEVPLQNLRGLMVLDPRFSATVKAREENATSPDPHMSAIGLPVPLKPGSQPDSKGKGGWTVLPGAPRVYSCKCMEHFSPATRIENWCKEHGDHTKKIVESIAEYFNGAKHIQGFVATPIQKLDDEFSEGESRSVLAALNFHWSDANLLTQRDPARSFNEAIFPIRALIARQLLRLSNEFKWNPSAPVNEEGTM